MPSINKRYDVFISYAHKDNPAPEYPITGLVELLKETYRNRYNNEEINVFFDVDGLKPGELWENKLLESLLQSAVMIVIISGDYYNSEYCRKEWQRFQDVEIHNSLPGTGIIPKKYGDVNTNNLIKPEVKIWIHELSKRQYFDISDWKTNRDTDAFKHRLVTVCEQIKNCKQRLKKRKKIPSNIRPHNENFTGRAQEIRDIHESLILSKVGVITAIKGIGGIGKSTIAYEYAHAYTDYYQGGTFNFNAEGQDDFRTALASIAAVMDIEFTNEERKSPDLQCQRVWGRISKGEPALLILDNVDKSDILKRITEHVPDLRKLNILVTSRQGFITSKNIQEFCIPPLNQSLSLDLLLNLFPAENEDELRAANSITLRLGGHPLSLTMVGTYLFNKKDMSYASQLLWLEDEGIEALDIMSSDINLNDYSKPVPMKIFEQAFSLLTPVETRVLEYAALLPPDSIPLPWIFEMVKDEFPEIIPDPKKPYRNQWNDLIQKLERHQLLLSSVKETKIAVMHRLIQEAIQKRCNESIKKYYEKICIHTESRVNFLHNDGWIPQENRWEITPLTAFSYKLLTEENEFAMFIAVKIASVIMQVGQICESKLLLHEANNILDKYHNDPDYLIWAAGIYSHLGIAELYLGNILEAKRFFIEAIKIKSENHSDSDHRSLASDYCNLGLVEQNLGNLLEAKNLLEKSINITLRYTDPEHHSMAIDYYNLGMIERLFDNLPEAKKYIEKAIKITLKHFDPEHHSLATFYFGLSIVELLHYNEPEAKRFLEKSIEITKTCYGQDHYNLAGFYSHLGFLEMTFDNLQDAKQLLEKSIDISLKYIVSDHHGMATCYSNLGLIEQKLGNLPEAKKLLLRAVEITEKYYGSDIWMLAIYYSYLCSVEIDLGNSKEAINMSRKSFLIYWQNERYDDAQGELKFLKKNDPNINKYLTEQGITLPDSDNQVSP